ncbi:MAG: manganese efflux pump MntP family protein [Paludibacteraceae bacterium]|nr:manganese efflux pump MntP family protein [Paludibacteraceae bacterium]
MDLLSIILLGIALAMDCFAVSIAQGLQQRRWCPMALVMAVLFGLFQGGMPLIGYGVGSVFALIVKRFAPWIALLLLGWIGGKMVYEACHLHDTDKPADWSLANMFLLAVATSIDALATGLIFIPYARQLWLGVGVIAFCSLFFSLLGYLLGVFVGKVKVNVELIGGLLLIGIGIKIFIEGICF